MLALWQLASAAPFKNRPDLKKSCSATPEPDWQSLGKANMQGKHRFCLLLPCFHWSPRCSNCNLCWLCSNMQVLHQFKSRPGLEKLCSATPEPGWQSLDKANMQGKHRFCLMLPCFHWSPRCSNCNSCWLCGKLQVPHHCIVCLSLVTENDSLVSLSLRCFTSLLLLFTGIIFNCLYWKRNQICSL